MVATIIECSMVLVGAFVMLFSIVKSKRIMASMSLVPAKVRHGITQLLDLHRLLMCFFLIGYVVVLAGFVLGSDFMGNAFVSLIFLAGAIFVYMGIAIEIKLLSEIQKTLGGLLPICARCRKVREPTSDGNDQKEWKNIEAYVSVHSEVDFTHGYCPQCCKEVLEEEGIGQS